MISSLYSDFGSRMIAIGRIYRRGVDRELARLGISDAMALPVMVIARQGGGVRLGVLAERLGLEAPSVLRIVDHLAAKSLVTRGLDAADKRAKMITLTPAGMAMAEQVEQIMLDVRAHLFAGVDEADMAAALRVFDGLEANLHRQAS